MAFGLLRFEDEHETKQELKENRNDDEDANATFSGKRDSDSGISGSSIPNSDSN